MDTLIYYALALVILLALIYAAIVIYRNMQRTGAGGRKGRRIGVVEHFSIDKERRLVLVRRDDVEHLILTGGENDLVIEQGIARAEQEEPEVFHRPALEPRPRPAPRRAPPPPEHIPEPEPQGHAPEAVYEDPAPFAPHPSAAEPRVPPVPPMRREDG